MWDSVDHSWLDGVLKKGSDLLPTGKVSLALVKYGPPIALVSYAGYRLWGYCSENAQELPQQEPEQEEPPEEFSGVLKLLPEKYDTGKFNEENTKAIYIILKGPILEIYEANEKIPLKELYNEPNLELTFYKRTIYNINGCSIKLLPEKLDRIFHWEYHYPIEIILKEGCTIDELVLTNDNRTAELNPQEDGGEIRSLVLFARSDRDKEAWTRRFKSAATKSKVPPRTEDPILSINAGKPYAERQPFYMDRKVQGVWLNTLLSRIVTDGKTKALISASLTLQVQELLDNLKIGDKIETLLRMTVHKIDLEKFGTPKIIGVATPHENDYGLWEEICIKYNGLLKIIVEIRLNPKTYGKEDIHRPSTQDYEDSPWISRIGCLNYFYLGGYLERTRFYIEINLDLLQGGVAFNIPSAPTDTAWLGFREGTRVDLSGSVFWGNWRLPFLYKIIDAINAKLLASFGRNFMIPNMMQMHLPMWRLNG